MRIVLILVFLTSWNVKAQHKLAGLWEGYDFQLKAYNSHILEIDENGNGFYAYTLSGHLDENSVFPINSNNLTYSDGYYKLVAKQHEDLTVTILFAENMLTDLNVITVMRGPDDKVALSVTWKLALVSDKLQNERLYRFAKELYNKPIK